MAGASLISLRNPRLWPAKTDTHGCVVLCADIEVLNNLTAIARDHFLSKTAGATTTTTTSDATISRKATRDTKMMLPLDAGNLPRMT